MEIPVPGTRTFITTALPLPWKPISKQLAFPSGAAEIKNFVHKNFLMVLATDLSPDSDIKMPVFTVLNLF